MSKKQGQCSELPSVLRKNNNVNPKTKFIYLLFYVNKPSKSIKFGEF